MAKQIGGEDAVFPPGVMDADMVIEFSFEAQKSKNVVSLIISALDTARSKPLFSLSALSSRRNLKQPGATTKATEEAIEKVIPDLIKGLTDHYWSLSRNGRWRRVVLENAPKGLEKKVEEKLKKECTQTERSPGKPGFLVQCKFDSLELSAQVDKVIRAAAPGVKYDTAAMTPRIIRLVFEAPKKKGRRKKK
jgi:hypothetical protein